MHKNYAEAAGLVLVLFVKSSSPLFLFAVRNNINCNYYLLLSSTSNHFVSTHYATTNERKLQMLQDQSRCGYEFVEEKIADILVAAPDQTWLDYNIRRLETSSAIIDTSSLCLQLGWEHDFFKDTETSGMYDFSYSEDIDQIGIPVLLHLASLCEYAVFPNPTTDSAATTKPTGHILPDHIQILLMQILSSSEKEEHDAHVVIACQLTLQMLETEIRNLLSSHPPGKAPLLKNMIEAIGHLDLLETYSAAACTYYSDLAKVLRPLLLPTGLNLRNLLWHGFLSCLHRRWLALVIVLLMSVKKCAEEQHAKTNIATDKWRQPQQDPFNVFQPLSQHGANLAVKSTNNVSHLEKLATFIVSSSFLPLPYLHLVRMAILSYSALHYPACFSAIMSPLLEHGIRLLWCECNNSDQTIARAKTYYVTLDGIGQRDRHELLLSPFLNLEGHADSTTSFTTSTVANQLVFYLGAPIMSLLTDLFASPCGGPNIRSALAHGSGIWDGAIITELNKRQKMIANKTVSACLADDSTIYESNTTIVKEFSSTSAATNIACTLLTVLQLLAEKAAAAHSKTSTLSPSVNTSFLPPVRLQINSFRPMFSYASSMMRDLEKTIDNLQYLDSIISDGNEKNSIIRRSLINMDGSHRRILNVLSSTVTLYRKGGGSLGATLSKAKSDILTEFDLNHLVELEQNDSSPWQESNCIWREIDLFQEYNLSTIVAKCGAARMLSSDVAFAIEQYSTKIKNGLLLYDQQEHFSVQKNRNQTLPTSSIQRRQHASFIRLVSLAPHALNLYFFCAYVSLCYLNNEISVGDSLRTAATSTHDAEIARKVLSELVRRCRMVVSTFSTCIISNSDRSIKAIEDFLAAKCVKKAADERFWIHPVKKQKG